MGASEHQDRALVGAVEQLLERGIVGFVWFDGGLVVMRRRGRLPAWIRPGDRHDAALPMLVGYEDELSALREGRQPSVVLPNVGIPDAGASAAKFDLHVFWLRSTSEFLAVLLHESTQGGLQLELHHEIAQRQLAEGREAELGRAFERANQELTRANRDLESFAYIVSHDLRAPLRAMRITADLLATELDGKVEATAKESIERLRQLSRRMGAMMSGLLEYARIGRKQEAMTEVDTHRLVSDVLLGIGAPASLRIEREGPWPVLRTLAEPLDVVLRNLIENAVKHHDTRVGVIRLSAHEVDDMIRFDVADDGPGINPSYHEAIFEPFRTISGETSADSSGIGLALVKKTAEIVGGRIELQSDPAQGRGTIFRLFWPKMIVSS